MIRHHQPDHHIKSNREVPINRRWLRRDATRGRFIQNKVVDRKLDSGFCPSNNIYPSLFHSWPLRAGRIDKTIRALERIDRRRQFILPERKDYQSTVDLYEAALPVLKAMGRLSDDPKSIAPVPSLSVRGMLKNLKTHLFF